MLETYDGGEVFRTLRIEVTAWDTWLNFGLRIPCWVIVLFGVLIGCSAAVAISGRWTPEWWAFQTGSLFGLAFSLLYLILVWGEQEESMMRLTSHPGVGVYCAVLAFGTMSVASWLLRPLSGSRGTARKPSRKSARRRVKRAARKGKS